MLQKRIGIIFIAGILIGAAISLLEFVKMYAQKLEYTPFNQISAILLIIILIGGLYLGIKEIRDRFYPDKFKYATAFLSGIGILIIAFVIVFCYLIYHYNQLIPEEIQKLNLNNYQYFAESKAFGDAFFAVLLYGLLFNLFVSMYLYTKINVKKEENRLEKMQIYYYDEIDKIDTPVVVTLGSFDGVHLGHQFLLQQLTSKAKENNWQSVVVTFDPHPQELLKTQPDFFAINSFNQKMLLFEKFGVDIVLVIKFDEQFANIEPQQFFENVLLNKLNAKAMFIGPNHHFGKARLGDAGFLQQLCAENEIELIIAEEFKMNNQNVRSTEIRDLLKNKQMQQAEKLMGHSIFL